MDKAEDKTVPPSPAAATSAARAAADALAPGESGFRPRNAAVALAYAQDGAAPKVVAKGRGLVAQAIIERAHQHGIFVHESKDMVSLLMQVDLDQRIPPELYRAVAELLAWVYRLEQKDPLLAAGTAQRLLPLAPPG
jgi:flagellar biosynthesis protein